MAYELNPDYGPEYDTQDGWEDYLRDFGSWLWDFFSGPSPAERLANVMASAPSPRWRELAERLDAMPHAMQREYAARTVGHVHWLEPEALANAEMIARYLACCEIGCTGGGVEQPCVDAAADIMAWNRGVGDVLSGGLSFEWPPNPATTAVLIVVVILAWVYLEGR